MKRALLAVLGLACAACRSAPVGPYAQPEALVRNTSEAERLTHLAGDVAGGNPAEAERCLSTIVRHIVVEISELGPWRAPQWRVG